MFVFPNKEKAFVQEQCGESSGHKHSLRLCLFALCRLSTAVLRKGEQISMDESVLANTFGTGVSKHCLIQCTSHNFSLAMQSLVALALYILIFESALHEIFLWDQGSVSSMSQGFGGYKIQMF